MKNQFPKIRLPFSQKGNQLISKSIMSFSMIILLCLALHTIHGCTKENLEIKAPETSSPEAPITTSNKKPSLPTGVYKISTIEIDSPLVELAPFGDVVGNAKVVSLGESAHRSLGFPIARNRLYRYLIEEKGFRAFAIEGFWMDAWKTNDFVHGQGTIQDGLDGLTYSVWQYQPYEDFLQWVKDWNTQHPQDDIVVFGFDMQDGSQPAAYLRERIQELVNAGSISASQQQNYLAGLAACPGGAFDTRAEALQDSVERSIIRVEKQFPQARCLACEQALIQLNTTLSNQFQGLKETYTQASLIGMKAYNKEVYYFFSNRPLTVDMRDKAMAEIFTLLRAEEPDLANKKTFMLAHNIHNQKKADELLYREWDFAVPSYSMGTWLDDWLGSDYVTIGLLAYRTEFFDPDLYSFTQGNAQAPYIAISNDSTALEKHIHQTISNYTYLFIDLDQATDTNSLLPPGKNYQFGINWWGYRNISVSEPVKHFDGIFFMKESYFSY